MKRRLNSDGFTLMELIIAMSLSSFVLVGIVMVTATVLRNHFDQIRRGEANVTTLYALQQMNQEIEEATHIVPGAPSTAGGNVIKGCLNYSSILASQFDGSGRYDTNANSSYFVYCVRTEANDSQGRPQYSLIRYAGTTCSAMGTPEATCGTAGSYDVVVLNRFYPDSPQTNRFWRTPERGVRLRYIVGVATPTANVPMPANFRVDTTVSADKAYFGMTAD